MITVNDIYNSLAQWAPVEGKLSWDNVGILVGDGSRKVTKIITALDITIPVIEEAKKAGAELIVSHHPVIFSPISTVRKGDVFGDRILALAEAGISAVCMHTNLDFAKGGVEDTLAEVLGMTDIAILLDNGEGRCGTLPKELPMNEFLVYITSKLKTNGLRYYDSGRPCSRICTCCGSGGDCLEAAVNAGCDTFISGDLKYPGFVEAAHYGINLVDAGHYPTENPIIEKLTRYLAGKFPEVSVACAKNSCENISYFVG